MALAYWMEHEARNNQSVIEYNKHLPHRAVSKLVCFIPSMTTRNDVTATKHTYTKCL